MIVRTQPEVLIGIHQPEAFPWLGFFDKLFQSDVFVLLDTVQFEKNYYQNRNRIRTRDGWAWITLPVLTKGRSSQAIAEVEINDAVEWRRKIKGTIEQHYRKAAHWAEYRDGLWEILDHPCERLADFNIAVIGWLSEALGVRRRMVRASTLGVAGNQSALLLNICRSLGATAYLSGVSGRTYLEAGLFQQAGIAVRFQEFHHPIYPQCYQPFVPQMSALDLLFTQGPRALAWLTVSDVSRLDEVFA